MAESLITERRCNERAEEGEFSSNSWLQLSTPKLLTTQNQLTKPVFINHLHSVVRAHAGTLNKSSWVQVRVNIWE